MKKNLITLFLFLIASSAFAYPKPDVYKIDAGKNAFVHNNLGLKCISEHDYVSAIQEFKIAIALNPNTQATAVYYNNLGDVYMFAGFYKYAQTCYEAAIKIYNLNFLYYQNLVKSFKSQGIVKAKIRTYSEREKYSLNMIILGLLYVENGDLKRGVIKLDEFCMREPDLIITGAVRNYIKGLVEKQYSN